MTTLSSFRTALAESFYDAIEGGGTNLYFFVGRTQPWDDENDPPSVVDTASYLNTARNDIAFLKRVQSSDCKFMVAKREWTTGTVYDQYDDSYGISVTYPIASKSGNTLNGDFDTTTFGEGWLVEGTNIPTDTKVLVADADGITLTDTPTGAVTSVTITNVSYQNAETLRDAEFYVVTDDQNVYVCLDNNNGGESTVEPTLVQSAPFRSVDDGYLWKYLFTVPTSYMDEFGTMSQIPVGLPITPAATGIHNVKVMHGGTSYTEGTTTITAVGDGENFTAEPVVEDGVVVDINVTNPGEGYTTITLTITDSGSGSGCVIRPIYGPPGGHGTNPVRELCSTALRLSKELSVDDTNQTLPVGNDYRLTGLIKDPLVFAGTEEFTGATGSACFLLTGPFTYADVEEDDYLEDSLSNRYRVVAKPAEEPEGEVSLVVQSVDGATPEIGNVITYTGGNAALTAVVSPDIDKYSGMVILLDTRVAYAPTDLQTISFKSTLAF